MSVIFFYITLDNYIGNRYNIAISIDDITVQDIIKEINMGSVQNQALTEAVYYILLSIQKPLHGYGIMQNTAELSKGRVKLAAGTLYGAINTMLEKQWIVAVENKESSRKKEYQITPLGIEILKVEMLRLNELLENGKSIMEGNTL